jgi:hypothetical protein
MALRARQTGWQGSLGSKAAFLGVARTTQPFASLERLRARPQFPSKQITKTCLKAAPEEDVPAQGGQAGADFRSGFKLDHDQHLPLLSISSSISFHASPSKRINCICSIGKKSLGPVLILMPSSSIPISTFFRLAA